MKKIFLIMLTVLLVGTFVLSGCAEPAPTTPAPTSTAPAPAEKIVNLRIQSAYPRGDLSMEGLVYFADAAAKYSNGTLIIEVFAEPEIVGMFQVQDAVVGGTLDMGMDPGGFWSGRGVKVGDIEFGLPYGFLIPEKATFEDKANEIRRFFFEDGLVDILRAEYAKQGVYWLDMHSYGPVPFLIGTEKAANAFKGTVDDIKDLIIRTDSLWMEWNNAMGMTGVDMGPMDAYTGLQTGTVDAHIWDVSVYIGMGFEEVAPYWIRGEENDHALGHILVNMDIWNSLSANQKDALAKAGEEYWNLLLADYSQAMKDVQALVDAGTVIEVQMSDEILALHEKTAYELWDEVAARDDACAQAVQLLKIWRGVE